MKKEQESLVAKELIQDCRNKVRKTRVSELYRFSIQIETLATLIRIEEKIDAIQRGRNSSVES